MINLVKNELNKIFHKKGLYILLVLVLGLSFSSFLISNFTPDSDDGAYIEAQYKYYEENLSEYDLSNREELRMYADDYAIYKELELKLDYPDSFGPEYYYIENTIAPVLTSMYYAKFVTENEIEYNTYKELYDSYVLKLKNFDWKGDLEQERKEYLEEKKSLKMALNHEEVDADEVKKQIETLDIQISGVDYRLKYNIPYANTDESNIIGDYVTDGIAYVNLDKDESLYKTKDELISKRLVEERYKVAKYKLENGIIEKSNTTLLKDIILYMFEEIDMIILIGMFIIIASSIADEFNKGTIKQLLVKPFTRSEILVSKILACIIATIAFSVIYLGVYTILYCWDYNDLGVLFRNHVLYDFAKQEVVEINFFVYCLLKLVTILPQYFIIFFFTLLVCIITTNAVGSMAAGIGLMMGAEMVTYYLSDKILAYLPFGCWNFSPYLFGGFSLNKYASLPLAIVVCGITLILLIGLSFIIFKRKDIKNQ